MPPNCTGPPVAHFESFAVGRGWNASFRDPCRQRTACALDEVIPLLQDAEKASREGRWVALALSYEAAPAFDSALDAKPSSEFPLAWMAVFGESLPTAVDSIATRPFLISEWEPQIGRRRYRRAIHSIRDYIERGDACWVNFTLPLRGYVVGDSFHCFRALAQTQGAAYSAYLDIGSHKILSFSPHLLGELRDHAAQQMASTVTPIHSCDTSVIDALRALFPCVSVTGAPRARSMAIIKELEQYPRGIYTGSIGLLCPNGHADFSVAVKTLVIDAKAAATIGVGSCITRDSTIRGEYEECCLKAQFRIHP
jgi:anthranilate/para-aminobenzoate synthase component I